MINSGMLSSNTDEYETPQELFNHYNSIFNFELDVCASDKNHKCKQYYSKFDNGLNKEWKNKNWMNPPYGRDISKWVEKAYNEGLRNKLTVCLLPSRTDTKWWHDYVLKSDVIHFIKGRLKFNNTKNSAPFPSVIVIFGLFKK